MVRPRAHGSTTISDARRSRATVPLRSRGLVTPPTRGAWSSGRPAVTVRSAKAFMISTRTQPPTRRRLPVSLILLTIFSEPLERLGTARDRGAPGFARSPSTKASASSNRSARSTSFCGTARAPRTRVGNGRHDQVQRRVAVVVTRRHRPGVDRRSLVDGGEDRPDLRNPLHRRGASLADGSRPVLRPGPLDAHDEAPEP